MIHELLAEGAENARPGKELAGLLKISMRELTRTIEAERRAGKPICATVTPPNAGYFLAANRDEMQQYCDSLQHRAGELHKTRKACIKTLDHLPV